MEIYEIILIGIALSMDACALTIANCTTYKKVLTKKAEWSMPITFALFQGLMPLIGYLIGTLFSGVIGSIAEFLTAGIFFVLAGKIIYDIIKDKCKEEIITSKPKCNSCCKFTLVLVLIQALATSIDALAVGITFVKLNFSVYIAVLIIATVTFLLVSLALAFGKKIGKLFGEYAEWVGAGILFVLACKALIEALI
jgi:putative Mn2+ efflux pump MntP